MSQNLSSLLSSRENSLLFHLLGQDCNASCCTVAQLCMATTASKVNGQKSEWTVHSCGVVCLVQDRKLNSTFIRLFSVKRSKLLWEQELYTPFKYSAPLPFFHTFPGDDCWVGLNFADDEEAGQFHAAVQKCISSTKAPVLMRTYSLDSDSGRVLRDKLKANLADSAKISRCGTLRPTPSDGQGVLNLKIKPGTTATGSNTLAPTSTISLAKKKGPLPPLPSSATSGLFGSTQHITESLIASYTIPLPPPYPAPTKPNPAGVRKSASFAPGRNYSSAILKRSRSINSTVDEE